MSQPVGLERGNGRIERTARLRLVQFNHARIECERWQHIVERCRTNAARHCLGSYNGEIVLKSGLVLRHSRSEEHTSELQSLMRISYSVSSYKKTILTSQILQP